MDITLREILQQADDIHQCIERNAIALKGAVLEDYVIQLQTQIRNIQAVSKRLADISNVATEILLARRVPNQIPTVTTYPRETDHVVLRNKYSASKHAVIPGVDLPVQYVDQERDIPVAPLYYVRQTNQYAVNVAGHNITGALANIVGYRAAYTSPCEYGIECRALKKASCTYWHRPSDWIKLGMCVPDTPRNFTVGSWIYSDNRNPRTYFARHIGGRNTCVEDLKRIKSVQYREEVINREGQLMHDLLIYLILSQKQLVDRYTDWNKK